MVETSKSVVNNAVHPRSHQKLKPEQVHEISKFYSWSWDYWVGLSSDPLAGFSSLLNFGCWDQAPANLYYAQQRLFDRVQTLLSPLAENALGLEIGCGVGGNAIRFCQQHQVQMEALDISPRQLDIAARNAVAAGCSDRLNLVCGSAMDMPFDAQRFDFSICIESSFHYVDLAAFVAEQYRVLKPGARAVIADITCEDASKIRFRQGNHFYPAERMQQLLTDQGFESIRLHRIGPHVFESLYTHAREFSGRHRNQVAKYWNLVLANYAALARKGLMGYDLFEVVKPTKETV